MFEPVDYDFDSGALIKVIGVGGGGGNAVNHMIQNEISYIKSETVRMNDEPHGKVEFFAINTDAQALRKSLVPQTIQIGGSITRGLGAGANPNIGRKAAEDDYEAIRAMLDGANMVFIAAGMGGGTGTGAAPVVAQIAKELGILTVAVVTKPFPFEGKRRMHFADLGIQELAKFVDSLIIIPNEKLRGIRKNITMLDAFAEANNVLRNSVSGISNMITSPGLINVDFADVKAVMTNMGRAMMGTGVASGGASEGRAEKAVQDAINSPLLENIDLSGAKGVLVNVTSGADLTMEELFTIGETVQNFAADDALIVTGTTYVPDMENEIRVTIVATGIGDTESVEPEKYEQLMVRSPKTLIQEQSVKEVNSRPINSEAERYTQQNQSFNQSDVIKPPPSSLPDNLDTPPFLKEREKERNLKNDENLLNVGAFWRNNK